MLLFICIHNIQLNISMLYYNRMQYTVLVSTMRISDETKKELVKIGGELSSRDGIERTLEDIVKLLISDYKRRN